MCPGSLGVKLSSLCALVRYFARKTLSHLWPCADFERVSSRVLGLTSLQQLSEAVELLRTKVRAALLLVVVVGGVTRLGCTLQGVGEHPVDVSSAKARHPSGDTSWACRSIGDSHSSSMSERRQQRGLLQHDSPQRKPSRPVRRQRSLSDAQVRGRGCISGRLCVHHFSLYHFLLCSPWAPQWVGSCPRCSSVWSAATGVSGTQQWQSWRSWSSTIPQLSAQQ